MSQKKSANWTTQTRQTDYPSKATLKQMKYLRDLGFKGDVDILKVWEASKLIGELTETKQSVYDNDYEQTESGF